MDRKILFRGKRMDNGKWVEGWYCPKKTGHYDGDSFVEEMQSVIIASMTGGGYQYAVVDPRTVCQYTGLADRNGKKIFEGDICSDGKNIVRILWNDHHQWGVEISKTEYILSRGLVFPLWQYDNCEMNGYRELEVIGNIFDNPALLEGGAE